MRKYPSIKSERVQNFFRSLFSPCSFQILQNAEQKELCIQPLFMQCVCSTELWYIGGKWPHLEFFWSVISRIQSESGKTYNRKAPNTHTFHTVIFIPQASSQDNLFLKSIPCLCHYKIYWQKKRFFVRN